MDHAKKLIKTAIDTMLQEEQLQRAGSLRIPFFVLRHELCKKTFLMKKYEEYDLDQLIQDVLFETFGQQISITEERLLQSYRGKMRRCYFVLGLDVNYDSDALVLYSRQNTPPYENFFSTQVMLDPGKLVPCNIIYEKVNEFFKNNARDIRPIDIKEYVLREMPTVTMLVKKRREYHGHKYDGNFFVGFDLVKNIPDYSLFFKTQVLLGPELLCPCDVIYDSVKAFFTEYTIRPMDIKQYILEKVPGVTIIRKKRREYKGEKIDANFFVGIDVTP